MSTPTIDDAPFLNPFSPEFQADPGPIIAELRRQSWLVRTPIGALVIGRGQVQALLGDRRLRSAVPDIMRLQGVVEGPVARSIDNSVLALEGEPHTRLRRLVSRAFTPRAVDRHRADMREILAALLERVAPLGRCDFMAAVADHYPIRVMCRLLGVPEEDDEQFARWNTAITWALSFGLGEHRGEVEWGLEQMSTYVDALIADRRRQPRDDLITGLVQAEEADDHLTDEEIGSVIGSLLFAGYDTTRNQLGLGMWVFAKHQDQWKLLGDDPSLTQNAVEEMLRFRPPVSGTPRRVVEAFDFDGYHLTPGTILMMSTISANSDPAEYVQPLDFDITLERRPHVTFGAGPHYCLGASLARAELQEAMPLLVAAMPNLALDGEPKWRPPLGIYGPQTLPIRFG
jgi:cytochrome P450